MGVVALSGPVEDEEARADALEAAERTPGVLRVEDRLQVKPEGGAEAEAKQTGFGTDSAARSITKGDCEKIV